MSSGKDKNETDDAKLQHDKMAKTLLNSGSSSSLLSMTRLTTSTASGNNTNYTTNANVTGEKQQQKISKETSYGGKHTYSLGECQVISTLITQILDQVSHQKFKSHL